MNELPTWKLCVLLAVAVPVILVVRYWKKRREMKNKSKSDELLAMGIATSNKRGVLK